MGVECVEDEVVGVEKMVTLLQQKYIDGFVVNKITYQRLLLVVSLLFHYCLSEKGILRNLWKWRNF